MINKLTVSFIIFTIFTIDAMEVKEKTCHLALLPAEIHAHITSYLPFDTIIESDDEFIVRTGTFGTLSDEHKLLVFESHEKYSKTCEAHDGSSSSFTLRTYSIDRSKIISFEKFTQNPQALIFDIENKTMQNSKRLATELSQETIGFLTHFTLSRNGSCCAQIQKRRQWPFTFKIMLYDNHLVVTNTLSQEVQKFLIPANYGNFISIGFNKQGTKVIVHAKENTYQDDLLSKEDKLVRFYHIFELTTPEEHKEKSETTLKAYLRSIRCCKNLANSLNS